MQKGWRLPEYTVTQESGPAHRKEFTMTCQVERFVEIGNRADWSSCSHKQCLASQQMAPIWAPSFPLSSLIPPQHNILWPSRFPGGIRGPELPFSIGYHIP